MKIKENKRRKIKIKSILSDLDNIVPTPNL